MSIPDLPDAPVMANAIMSLVRERPRAIFVGIVKRLRQLGIPVDGDVDIHLGPPNIFLWFDVTQDLADCIIDLVGRQVVCIHPSNYLVYLFDGGIPRLPIATRVTARGYRKPHWLPVVFWLTPPCGKSKNVKP